MNVLDVAQNSVAAGAKLVQITLEADEARDLLEEGVEIAPLPVIPDDAN